MVIVEIAIKCDSKGPVIFKQNRTRRTMYVDNDVRDFSKEDKHTKVGTF